MRLVVLTWEGTPQDGEPYEIGRVVLVEGRAMAEQHLVPLLESLRLETTPDDGARYLSELAARLHNQPYQWAELQKDDDEPYPRWETPAEDDPFADDPYADRFMMHDDDITIIRE